MCRELATYIVSFSAVVQCSKDILLDILRKKATTLKQVNMLMTKTNKIFRLISVLEFRKSLKINNNIEVGCFANFQAKNY